MATKHYIEVAGSNQNLAYDLFCGEGIVTSVLLEYFNYVIGVDIKNFEHCYPGQLFFQGDCTQLPASFFKDHQAFIWASPCCQKYSRLTAPYRVNGKEYLETVLPTVQLLAQLNNKSVIENVECAPIRKDLKLCGSMFGLPIVRHRYFQINNAFVMQPPHNGCRYIHRHRSHIKVAGTLDTSMRTAKQAMNFTGQCTREGLSQSVPPDYVHFILQSLGYVRRTVRKPVLSQ